MKLINLVLLIIFACSITFIIFGATSCTAKEPQQLSTYYLRPFENGEYLKFDVNDVNGSSFGLSPQILFITEEGLLVGLGVDFRNSTIWIKDSVNKRALLNTIRQGNKMSYCFYLPKS